jgi:anti-anti-sigma regulatory factor
MERRSDPGESSCTVTASGGVELVGEHDVASAQEFATALEGAAQMSAGTLVVDLSRATFIDSSIAAALMRCARELVREGRDVAIRVTDGSAPATVMKIVGLASQPGIAVETVPVSDGG